MSRYQSKYTGSEIDTALDAFNEVKEYKVKLDPTHSGYYNLEANKKYRIYSSKNSSGRFSHRIEYVYQSLGSPQTTWLYSQDVKVDPDAEYEEFKFIQASENDEHTEITIVWELNGERYQSTAYGTMVFATDTTRVDDADEVLCIKEDISIKALSGDSVFIRYSAHADGKDFTEEWSSGQKYIGFATGLTAPTVKDAYTWCKFTGSMESDDFSYEELVAEITENVLNNLPIAEEVSV